MRFEGLGFKTLREKNNLFNLYLSLTPGNLRNDLGSGLKVWYRENPPLVFIRYGMVLVYNPSGYLT